MLFPVELHLLAFSDFCEFGFPHGVVFCIEDWFTNVRESPDWRWFFWEIGEALSEFSVSSLSPIELLFQYKGLGGCRRSCVTTMEDIQRALELQVANRLVEPLNRRNSGIWQSWSESFFEKEILGNRDIARLLLHTWFIDYEDGEIYVYLNCPFCTVAWEAAQACYLEAAFQEVREFFPNEQEEWEESVPSVVESKKNRVVSGNYFLEGSTLPLSRS